MAMLAGCGNPTLIKEDPTKKAARETAGKGIRSYFDKSNGNYEALSAEDKAKLNAITGSESNSKIAFSHMVPNGGAGEGAPASGSQ